MGTIPRPLLALVAVILGLCMMAGFALGVMPSLKRGASADDEGPPSAQSAAASGTGIRDAQPLAEPPPPAAKAKTVAAASDAASDAAPVIARPVVASPPPTEAAPAASAPPAPVKLPGDLPPT